MGIGENYVNGYIMGKGKGGYEGCGICKALPLMPNTTYAFLSMSINQCQYQPRFLPVCTNPMLVPNPLPALQACTWNTTRSHTTTSPWMSSPEGATSSPGRWGEPRLDPLGGIPRPCLSSLGPQSFTSLHSRCDRVQV